MKGISGVSSVSVIVLAGDKSAEDARTESKRGRVAGAVEPVRLVRTVRQWPRLALPSLKPLTHTSLKPYIPPNPERAGIKNRS